MAEDHITVKKSTYNKILAALVMLAVAFSFFAGFFIGGGGKVSATGNSIPTTVQEQLPAQAPSQQQDERLNNIGPGRRQVSLDDDPQLGNTNAKVTVIEFSDFECPFCGRFFQQSIGPLKAEYIDTGKVKFVYRDFPLDSIHPNAKSAAVAAQCALEQGKFWEFHDKIFQNQLALNSGNYKKWASELALDTAKFNSCLDSNKYDSEVDKDFQDGVNAGVSGTPTFFIGSADKGFVQVVGAQPYSVIKQVIEQELAG